MSLAKELIENGIIKLEICPKCGKPKFPKLGEGIILQGDARHLSALLQTEIDTCITSPPYSDTYLGGGDSEKRKERLIKAGHDPKEFLGGKARNVVLKHYDEVDAIVTSPPYGNRLADSEVKDGDPQRASYALAGAKDERNIGRLPIDAVVTSPPYEHQLHDSAEKRAAGAWEGSELDVQKNLPMGYSESKDNIGNLKSETYLEAVLKVYGECYKVLRPNGLAIVVVKPFIRNKKVVDLPYHTWLLMAKVGFKLEKLYKLRLKTQSFWRILYEKRYPDVPRVGHEYILVCRKASEV